MYSLRTIISTGQKSMLFFLKLTLKHAKAATARHFATTATKEGIFQHSGFTTGISGLFMALRLELIQLRVENAIKPNHFVNLVI